MRRKTVLLIGLILVLSIVAVDAKEDSLKILAVAEVQNGSFVGHLADLKLEIKPGTGRVFIDTFPISKLDTQISTRFAKEVACRLTKKNCRKLDFFYTIRSTAAIVGGPSAGAATTVLTVALLEDYQLDKSIAITGTINSGNLIGSVAGVKSKLRVAAENGIDKILIPRGDGVIEENNETTDLFLMANDMDVQLREVDDIEDALFEFTGVDLRQDVDIELSENYEKIMKTLAVDLCNRTNYILGNVAKVSRFENETIDMLQRGQNNSARGKQALLDGKYYSAASFCFGANIQFNNLLLIKSRLDGSDIKRKERVIRDDQEKLNEQMEQMPIKTIADLQAYFVVKERLIDVDDHLDRLRKALDENNTEAALYRLAYATERLYSAYSWSSFFNHHGKEFDLNEEHMEATCTQKIYEAEERYNFADLFVPTLIKDIRRQINSAYAYKDKKDHEMCIFQASLAKARANVIVSTLNVPMSQVDKLLDQKLEAARKSIAVQTSKGIFPILGYSYYEYADSLSTDDKFSSLLYLEYALELSNMDLYFGGDYDYKEEIVEKVKYQTHKVWQSQWTTYIIVAVGAIVAIFLGVLLYKNRARIRRTKLRLRD